MSDKTDTTEWRNFYGRIRGKTMRASQKAYLAEDLGALRPRGVGRDENPDRRPIDTAAIFGDARPVWLEIGFGGGEHLAEQARRHPDVGFIGCEPFIEGMAKALTQVEAGGLENVRFLMDDARPLVARLKPGSLARVFILFPDPWPKKRQQKRRLIQPGFLDDLHRACRAGARIRFATDVAGYADEALWQFLRHGGFDWQAEGAGDWRVAPEDHVTTRYETKKLGDCAPVWFDFITQ